MKPTKYKTKDGQEKWRFQIYLGDNPVTGKPITRKKSGFSSKNDALIAYSKMLEDRENNVLTVKQLNYDKLTIEQVYLQWHEEYSLTVERSTLSKVESYYKKSYNSRCG